MKNLPKKSKIQKNDYLTSQIKSIIICSKDKKGAVILDEYIKNIKIL